MENFESLINNYVSSELKDENYFHPLGKYYIANTKLYNGYYWYYESSDFIIDIHNLFILEDFVEDDFNSMKNDVVLFLILYFPEMENGLIHIKLLSLSLCLLWILAIKRIDILYIRILDYFL